MIELKTQELIVSGQITQSDMDAIQDIVAHTTCVVCLRFLSCIFDKNKNEEQVTLSNLLRLMRSSEAFHVLCLQIHEGFIDDWELILEFIIGKNIVGVILISANIALSKTSEKRNQQVDLVRGFLSSLAAKQNIVGERTNLRYFSLYCESFDPWESGKIDIDFSIKVAELEELTKGSSSMVARAIEDDIRELGLSIEARQGKSYKYKLAISLKKLLSRENRADMRYFDALSKKVDSFDVGSNQEKKEMKQRILLHLAYIRLLLSVSSTSVKWHLRKMQGMKNLPGGYRVCSEHNELLSVILKLKQEASILENLDGANPANFNADSLNKQSNLHQNVPNQSSEVTATSSLFGRKRTIVETSQIFLPLPPSDTVENVYRLNFNLTLVDEMRGSFTLRSSEDGSLSAALTRLGFKSKISEDVKIEKILEIARNVGVSVVLIDVDQQGYILDWCQIGTNLDKPVFLLNRETGILGRSVRTDVLEPNSGVDVVKLLDKISKKTEIIRQEVRASIVRNPLDVRLMSSIAGKCFGRHPIFLHRVFVDESKTRTLLHSICSSGDVAHCSELIQLISAQHSNMKLRCCVEANSYPTHVLRNYLYLKFDGRDSLSIAAVAGQLEICKYLFSELKFIPGDLYRVLFLSIEKKRPGDFANVCSVIRELDPKFRLSTINDGNGLTLLGYAVKCLASEDAKFALSFCKLIVRHIISDGIEAIRAYFDTPLQLAAGSLLKTLTLASVQRFLKDAQQRVLYANDTDGLAALVQEEVASAEFRLLSPKSAEKKDPRLIHTAGM